MEDKKSKLSEIRATAFDVTVIMKQIGTPGFLESLSEIRDTISQVNEIIQLLQTPEMVRNIENFYKISENLNDSSARIQNTVKELKESGLIDKTSSLVDSARAKIDSIDKDSLNIGGVVISSQEMITSITGLVDEITQTVSYSKKSATVSNIRETMKSASEIYQTISG